MSSVYNRISSAFIKYVDGVDALLPTEVDETMALQPSITADIIQRKWEVNIHSPTPDSAGNLSAQESLSMSNHTKKQINIEL